MNVTNITARIPEYAKDLRLNLAAVSSPAGAPGLSESQIAGTALAAAIASRNAWLREALADAVGAVLGAEQQRAVRAAASIMAMNNVYYRSAHLIGEDSYTQMPARLRMNVIANPGVDKVDFEIYALAVSAINGCGSCLSSHERAARQHGLSAEAVQSVLRIAATISGIAIALESDADRLAAAA